MVFSNERTAAGVVRYLVLSDPSMQYAVVPTPGMPMVVVELASMGEVGPRAVEYLPESATETRRIVIVSAEGECVAETRTDQTRPVWSGYAIAPSFADLLGTIDVPGGVALHPEVLAPLMVLRQHEGTGHRDIEVLMSTRLRAIGAVFARVARFPTTNLDVWAITREALGHTSAYHRTVAIEWQEFTKYDQEHEVEIKINLLGPVSIWSLATSIAPLVGGYEFPGFIPDVGNELQRWESKQQFCEILAPADQVGYISYREQASGCFLKYKVFSEDTMRRKETLRQLENRPMERLPELLARMHPELVVRPLPAITRARFDINLESAATGHCFGIAIDEVTVDESGQILRQAEIEYYRSRIHDGLDTSTIVPEMTRLAGLVEAYLQRRDIPCERTFYSKLTFLRECADQRELVTG